MDKRLVIFFIILVLIFVYGLSYLINLTEDPVISKTLKAGETVLNIDVADTDAKRATGLSNRESLPKGSGLLFVFEEPGYYQFWMKDMNFPIDIAWINENKRIVHIESNVSQFSFPQTYTSFSPAKYVLETNANFFENAKIKIGDKLEF